MMFKAVCNSAQNYNTQYIKILSQFHKVIKMSPFSHYSVNLKVLFNVSCPRARFTTEMMDAAVQRND